MELERVKKHAQLKLKNEHFNKICTREDGHPTYWAKRKIASRNAQRRPCNDCEKQRLYIDRNRDPNCTYDNKRQAAKRPCIKHPGHSNRKDDHCNNHPKKLGYEKLKRNVKVSCPIYSFLDKPVKHLWADCSKNQANQRKQAPRSAVNAHHAAIDNCYLSIDDRSLMKSDNTEATNDHSLNCHLTRDYNDSFVSFEAPLPLVAFEAPPPPACKKVAEKVKHPNRSAKSGKKTTASSNDNSKAMVYTQPFVALAKGLDKPLAFSLEND